MLPFVIMATTLIAVLALAAVASSWRGFRAARVGANGVRAQYAAEEALAMQLNAWPHDTLTAAPLGVSIQHTYTTAAGDRVSVHITRPHPLVALVTADAELDRLGVPARVHRHITRAMHLAPPDLPLTAALTSMGTVSGSGTSSVLGADVAQSGDACGALRDTASVQAVRAMTLEAASPGAWVTTPGFSAIGDSIVTRARLEKAWIALLARSRIQATDSTGVTLTPSLGWHSLLLTGATVTTQGSSRWRGVLSVNGDLVVTGRLEIEGVLVVRGHLDARNGELRIRGAAYVISLGNQSAQLGDRTTIQFDRCAVHMALATVAEPTSNPFAMWYSRLN